MRHFAVAAVGLILAGGLAACASPPPAPERHPVAAAPARAKPELTRDIEAFLESRRGVGGRTIPDLTVEDADLRDVVAAISSTTGQRIVVAEDVHERITISLRGIPWRDALDVVAKMCRCDVFEKEGMLVVAQPSYVTVEFKRARTSTVAGFLAVCCGSNAVVAEGCDDEISFSESRCGYDQYSGFYQKLLGELALVPTFFGKVQILARRPIAPGVVEDARKASHAAGPVLEFACAYRAPAKQWFELLRGVAPDRVEIPRELDGDIRATLFAVTLEDAIVATAVAHGNWVRLEDGAITLLGAGSPPRPWTSPGPLELQAVVVGPDKKGRALISGQVCSPGDELVGAKGRVVTIDGMTVTLEVGPARERIELQPAD